ncbi:MAG: HAD-IIIA family hydrolase, partial [Bacteroidia bacterium]|nr:HAD-IIIA family hydrolase [Bacteroidia bacterium]
MHKAVFLDRDGVVNKEIGYVTCADELELLPDSIKAMKELQQKGYLLIIITNQGGITKGLYSELDLKNIHDKMKNELEEQGIKITEI